MSAEFWAVAFTMPVPARRREIRNLQGNTYRHSRTIVFADAAVRRNVNKQMNIWRILETCRQFMDFASFGPRTLMPQQLS